MSIGKCDTIPSGNDSNGETPWCRSSVIATNDSSVCSLTWHSGNVTDSMYLQCHSHLSWTPYSECLVMHITKAHAGMSQQNEWICTVMVGMRKSIVSQKHNEVRIDIAVGLALTRKLSSADNRTGCIMPASYSVGNCPLYQQLNRNKMNSIPKVQSHWSPWWGNAHKYDGKTCCSQHVLSCYHAVTHGRRSLPRRVRDGSVTIDSTGSE